MSAGSQGNRCEVTISSVVTTICVYTMTTQKLQDYPSSLSLGSEKGVLTEMQIF